MVGLTRAELEHEIERRMAALDELQEDNEHLGAYGDLLRLTAQIAYYRAADLIEANNARIEAQLKRAGVTLPPAESEADVP